jgi:hypothetical protein
LTTVSISIDALLRKTFEAAAIFYLIPALAAPAIVPVQQALLREAEDLFESRAERFRGVLGIDAASVRISGDDTENQEREKRLMQQRDLKDEVEGSVPQALLPAAAAFNAANHLFVSTAVARLYPSLFESKLVLRFSVDHPSRVADTKNVGGAGDDHPRRQHSSKSGSILSGNHSFRLSQIAPGSSGDDLTRDKRNSKRRSLRSAAAATAASAALAAADLAPPGLPAALAAILLRVGTMPLVAQVLLALLARSSFISWHFVVFCLRLSFPSM